MYSRAYVEITNMCNLHCSFCPGNARPRRRMTIEEFDLITDRLRGVTDYLYYHVMGEPLSHPLLPDFIRMARAKGFKSAVTTNGTLLPRVGTALVDAGVYKVNISVHSFEDGTDEDYFRYIGICTDFADYASRRGVLVILRLWNQNCDEGRNERTMQLFREAFGDADNWKHSARGIRIRDKLHIEYGERFEWPDMNEEDRGEQVFCYGLKDHFGILCDGSVIPCCLDHEGAVTLGNIFETSIEEILASPRACAMREGFKNRRATEELCRKCGYARRF